MSVGGYLARRLVGFCVTLLIASFAVFSLMYIAPGSPLTFVLGPRTTSPEQVAAVKARYNLDDPFLVRYWDWLSGVLHGDLGRSIVMNQNVADLISTRLVTTAMLVAYATVLFALVGVALGALSARRPGAIDKSSTIVATLMIATPTFVLGTVLITFVGVELGWFPTYGAGTGLYGRLTHLTMPAVTLAFASAGYLARITRSALRDELGREHVETARSRGLSERTIFRRHVLRNAMIPIVTVSGLTIGALIAGAVIVETIFALDGLGSLLVEAILKKDFAIVQGVVLILVTVFMVINLVTDVLYTLIDPRLELGADPNA
jgi:peptide/nickel transport system permease protein